MELVNVNSSNIKSIGYENNTLVVKFNTGSIYWYSNVPQNVYEELLNAPSKGHYLNESVKNKYADCRLSD